MERTTPNVSAISINLLINNSLYQHSRQRGRRVEVKWRTKQLYFFAMSNPVVTWEPNGNNNQMDVDPEKNEEEDGSEEENANAMSTDSSEEEEDDPEEARRIQEGFIVDDVDDEEEEEGKEEGNEGKVHRKHQKHKKHRRRKGLCKLQCLLRTPYTQKLINLPFSRKKRRGRGR